MARKLLVAAVIVTGALALVAGYRYLRPGDLEPIGGDWYVRSMSAYWVGHSANWQDLYRKSGFRYIRVDTHVSHHRFYAPDCVVFQSDLNKIRERTTGMPMTDVIVAACGTHNPIAMDMNAGETRYEEEGLVTNYAAGYSSRSGALLPQATEVTSITQIRELVNQQPPYRDDWRAHASFELKLR